MISKIKKITCRALGHKFKPAKQYLLPARQCCRCKLHQVKIPDPGSCNPGWVNSYLTGE